MKISKTNIFAARCSARAALVRAHQFEFIESVDVMQGYAEHLRLVEEIGQDEVQKIMANAFQDVPR